MSVPLRHTRIGKSTGWDGIAQTHASRMVDLSGKMLSGSEASNLIRGTPFPVKREILFLRGVARVVRIEFLLMHVTHQICALPIDSFMKSSLLFCMDTLQVLDRYSLPVVWKEIMAFG